jgi:LacI family transcriptional regulator
MFVSTADSSTALEKLQAAGIPVVVIDRVPKSYRGPAVVLDNAAAGRMAAEHLLGLGHTRIAHINGPDYVHIARERLAGFQQALADHGLTPVDIELADDWQLGAGYRAMLRLLARRADFTAVFCAGDLLAIGSMAALREQGRPVPQDVSVISIDDIELAAYLEPPLTTVSQSIARMATSGIQLLFEVLAGGEPDPLKVVIQPDLVLRQSTAAPQARRT